MGRHSGEKKGSIFYNAQKNRWQASYYIVDKDSKKEKRLTKTFIKKEEAEQFLSNILYQKNNEIFIKNNGIPLNQLMRANIQKKLDMNIISETQYARVLKTIEIIEKSPIVKKKIEDLTSEEIQEYMNTLTNYSNSYIKKIYEQFTQSYKLAMNKGYISKNPLYDVIKPRSVKEDKIVRALEVEEQQDFTNYLISKTIKEEPYKNIYLIQMYMGLRVGEALALRSTDIDLQKNIIQVNKTITTDKDGKTIMGGKTKTNAGKREIPIPECIRNEIIEQMQVAENNFDKQLFVSKKGNYVDSRNVNRILKLRLEKLGISGISTHSLRHTYGTRCVEAGMRAVALQRLMGHTDVSITLNTYTSVFNKYKESELEKVNQYYMNNAIFVPQKEQFYPNKVKQLSNTEIEEER